MRFYSISLDSIYLTSDGTETGDKCKLSVSGIEAALLPYHGQTVPAIDGTPITHFIETAGKGVQIEIRIETLMKGVWEDIQSLIHTALENSDTINLSGAGDTGNLDLTVIPVMPQPYAFEGFINERIKGVTLRFITT